LGPKSFARSKPSRAGRIYTLITIALILGIVVTYFNSAVSYWKGISNQQEMEIDQLIKELETTKLELAEIHTNLSLKEKRTLGIEGLEKGQLDIAGEVIDVYELLALPPGMDEYYDETRTRYISRYSGSYSDANLFRVMMVLHDSGRLSLDGKDYRELYGKEPKEAAEEKLRALIKRLVGFESLEGREKIPRLWEAVRRNNLEVIDSFVSNEIGNLGRADYPRFPLETLSLRNGDSEDKAVLLAALLSLEGYETGLLSVFDPENNFYYQALGVKDEAGWVRNKQMFKGYERDGFAWILLDPFQKTALGELPPWTSRYLSPSGSLAIPSTKYVFTVIDLAEVRAGEKAIPQGKTSTIIRERGQKSSVNLLAVVNGEGVTIPLEIQITDGEGRLLLNIDDTVFVTNTQTSIATALRVAKALTGAKLADKDIIVRVENPYTETLMLEGESAGASIAVALTANILGLKIKEDVVLTGTVNEDGTIGKVGDVPYKAEGAKSAGISTLLVPMGQGVSVEGLQVVEVGTIEEAFPLMTE
jgi:hypothetical protein